MLLLDGGVVLSSDWVQFAGFSPLTYSGNLGGRVGAHAICAAAFTGSHFCEEAEYSESVTGAAVPAAGAWIDNWDDTQPGARSISTTCNRWSTGTAAYEGRTLRPDGTFSSSYVNINDSGCGQIRAVACCVTPPKKRLRGFTPTSFNGNLGGRVGAHAQCASAFPGSHFCDENEYARATSGLAVPAAGAWIDNWDSAQPGGRSISTTCNRWTTGTTSYEGITLRTDGTFSSSYVNINDSGCGQVRPLACCE